MKRKIVFKFQLIISITLITIGSIIENFDNINNYFMRNSLNLNLSEIDTNYDDDILLASNPVPDTSWVWPATTNYYITSRFSNYHPAIDIVSTDGNFNIVSAYSGTVITNSYKYDNGNYLVILQDNGYYIMYAHLSQKLVNVNDHVDKGQLIGIMGSTGYATGTHLHFAVWEGYPHMSKAIDPFSFYDSTFNR